MTDSLNDLPLFSDDTASRVGGETELLGPIRSDTSLSAATQAWGSALSDEGKSIHTVKAFTGDLRLLAKFLGGGIAIGLIGTHDLKNFLDWMLNKRGVPCSPKTYSRRVTSLKAFFRWLVQINVLVDNPSDPIPQQTVLSPLPTVLHPTEVAAVLGAAEKMWRSNGADARPYTLLRLLLDTAIKKGECLAIHINHIDLDSMDGAILYVRYDDVTKRYKERKLTLSDEWIQAYQNYQARYKPTEQLFPWSPRRLEYLLEDIGEAAGIDKHLSFDMCRWSSALTDYRSGLDPNKIRQKMGVSKIQWREVGKKLERLAQDLN